MSGTAPEGYHVVTPYITARGASEAIAFYVSVFGATETARITGDDGRIGHAEVTIGDSPMMIADEHPEIDVLSPLSLGGTSVTLHLFVEDADATVARAVAAGATLLRPVADQFAGMRNGIVRDPWGHRWMIASVPPSATRDAMLGEVAGGS